MTYPNLKAEMARNGLTVADVAQVANAASSTVYCWMKGSGKPSIEQAINIQEQLFPECDVKYLFASK